MQWDVPDTLSSIIPKGAAVVPNSSGIRYRYPRYQIRLNDRAIAESQGYGDEVQRESCLYTNSDVAEQRAFIRGRITVYVAL